MKYCIIFSIILITLSTGLVAAEKTKKNQVLNKIFNQKDEKTLTLEDIDKLGSIPLLKSLPEQMYKKLGSCKPYNERFTKCERTVAGKIVGETFRRKGGYGEKYPGKMMEAMAYYEILYLTSLYKERKKIKKFREKYSDKKFLKKRHKSLRSLIKMNDGREQMRSALGMTLKTPTEDAIKRFWTLGEFLNLGTPKKLGKLDEDMSKRKKLLQRYKSKLSKLNKKLEES
jgi:hypothetical protein